jgi:hypothetical protein
METVDNKTVSMTVDDGNLVIKVDPNKDGDAVIVLYINLLEVPDELVNAFKKK